MKVSNFFKVSFFSMCLGVSTVAGATVDAMIDYVVLRSAVQTEGYCEQKLPMLAEFGTPAAPYLQGLFSRAPVAHHRVGQALSFENVNVLAQGISHQVLNETYSEAQKLWTYQMRINLSSLSDGATSQAQRADVITKAKLAIIGINSNLRASVGTYRLYLRVQGLPSQQGLSGERVYEQTQYPYTASSPLLRSYRQELINVEGECS